MFQLFSFYLCPTSRRKCGLTYVSPLTKDGGIRGEVVNSRLFVFNNKLNNDRYPSSVQEADQTRTSKDLYNSRLMSHRFCWKLLHIVTVNNKAVVQNASNKTDKHMLGQIQKKNQRNNANTKRRISSENSDPKTQGANTETLTKRKRDQDLNTQERVDE